MKNFISRLWLCLAVPGLVATASDDVLPIGPIEPGQAATPQVLVEGSWGVEPGAFGMVDEASRPGPMDFAVGGENLYVLDPVNGRVQVFGLDGGLRSVIPIGTRTGDFLAVDDTGRVTVLDAFVRREFKTFDDAGTLLARAAVPASVALPSAIFANGDRYWIEERHDRVHEVRVAGDRFGPPAEVVNTMAGRPAAGSRHTVHAHKDGRHGVVIRVGAAERAARTLACSYRQPVVSIAALETDETGRVYVAASCRRAEADTGKTTLLLTAIEPDGTVAAAVELPNRYFTDHYRKLLVTPEGEIVQMQTTADGVRFVRWTLPTPHQKGAAR